MNDTWNRNEFKDELEALLNIHLPVSQSKIESLRNLAIRHPKHRNYIVQCICKFIEMAPPDYRLPGLYLIDAIVRRCKDDKEEDRIASEYRKRFFVVFKDGALTGLFHPCIEKDKTRVDKVLNFWSEHVFPKQFVEQLKITVNQDIERRRQPVVLPTNYATDIALQQQGWQPGNTPTPPPTELTNTHSVSPPVDNSETDNVPSRLPPQLPLDFSNAVMHFLSVLNYGGSLPMSMPMYGFPPTQYPYLSHTTAETTRSPTEEVHFKTEHIPTCAERTIPEQSSTVVKKEVMDTPFDRPPVKDPQSTVVTNSLPPPPRTPPLPPSPSPTQIPPSTPPLPPALSAQVPITPSKLVQPPRTPPLPPKTPPLPPMTTPLPPKTPPLPPATLHNPVKADTLQTVIKPTLQQTAYQQPIPPPKTPPPKSIPPPKTPPLPPQVPKKRLREPSPVSLSKKVIKNAVPLSNQQPIPMAATKKEPKVTHVDKPVNFTLNGNNSKAVTKDNDMGKVTSVSKDIAKSTNGSDTNKIPKSTIQEYAITSPALPLTEPSLDAVLISRTTIQKKMSTVEPTSRPSVKVTKSSRWDIKAKNSKLLDTKDTTNPIIDSKTRDSPTNGANRELHSSTGVIKETKNIGDSAKTPTAKRETVSTSVMTETTAKRKEVDSSTTKASTEATSNKAEGPKPSIVRDTDIDKLSNANVKNKCTTPDNNTREPSPKRSKTTTISHSDTTSNGSDIVSTKHRGETETKSSNARSSISPSKIKKPSPQPTKDRGSSSRSTDQDRRHKPRDDRHSTRDYARERDDRHPYDREKDGRRDYDREKDDLRYYSPHQQHDQPQRHSTPYSPTQSSGQPIDPVYSYSRFARPGPISDPTLRLGTIRVLSRTLYVGPMSIAIEEDEVAKVFSQFGEVMSVIFSYRPDKLKNAFVKFINRDTLQAAKDGSDGITFRSRPVKVNWAHGFGPKHCFNYEKGESILILNRLSDEDCASLKAAPVGGFQGSRLRDQVTVEEPGPLQQSTHREESPNFYQVQKFEESERMPQSEYQQYCGDDYPPISNSGYTQTPVEVNGLYDQQGNYVYYIAEPSPAYYGSPVYPASGAAGQPQYYQSVPMHYQQPTTPPTSQQYQYTYNTPNYAPTNQAYYFQQQYQSPSAEYPPDYRRQ